MGRPRKFGSSGSRVISSTLEIEDHGDKLNCHVTFTQSVGVASSEVVVTICSDFLKSAGVQSVLHWGRASSPSSEWEQTDGLLPLGSVSIGDGRAAQTPFVNGECTLRFTSAAVTPDVCDKQNGAPPLAPDGISFVIKQTAPHEVWWKSTGGNFYLVVSGKNKKEDVVDSDITSSGGRAVCPESVIMKYVEPEYNYSHWSQFQRFCLCLSSLASDHSLKFEEACMMTMSLRLAKLRMVDWFRSYNYQPKDFTHVQEQLSVKLAKVCSNSMLDQRVRALLRLCVNYVPRGSSTCGDAIRMTILNIMRSHGIREGHRPGIEDKFLEQWHQKLHTNSAPDDIGICEAYLAFLDSGNSSSFWDHLRNHHNLPRDKLSRLPHPITHEPLHLPQLKGDMHNFLGLLKSVHCGANLDFITESCKGQISHEAECMAFNILNNRHAWWVPGKINECRRHIESDRWKRDVLMLDCALEDWQLTLLGREDVTHMPHDQALDVINVMLESWAISRHDPNIGNALTFFSKILRLGQPQRWSADWCRLMLAALERVQLNTVSTVDSASAIIQQGVDKLADCLQPNCYAIEKWNRDAVASFGEETARSLPELHISRYITRLMPVMRENAGLGVWDVVSDCTASNLQRVCVVDSLDQYAVSTCAKGRKTLCVCASMTGWEDIPVGIGALLVSPTSQVDVLSHVAVRARSQRVFLATCASWDTWHQVVNPEHLKSLANTSVCYTVSITKAGEASIVKSTPPATDSVSTTASSNITSPSIAGNGVQTAPEISPSTEASTPVGNKGKKATDKSSMKSGSGIIGEVSPLASTSRIPTALVMSSEDALKKRNEVGNKSFALLELVSKAGDSKGVFSCPKSVCVPFGVAEQEMADKNNQGLREQCERILLAVSTDLVNNRMQMEMLMSLRRILSDELYLSDALESAISEKLKETELHDLSKLDSVTSVDDVTVALRKVWASKWNERAVQNRRANGFPDSALFMAVLIQNLIEADYSFVIHTKNPISSSSVGENCGSLIEVVVGLGETLVSNAPGRALSAIVYPGTGDAGPTVEVLRYFSKDRVLRAPSGGTLVCRSDSNGEDLESFAGAGLYDSFYVDECKQHTADYSHESLVFDEAFRTHMLQKLYLVGQEVFRLSGGKHKDIEGCVKDSRVYVVQSRDQMDV